MSLIPWRPLWDLDKWFDDEWPEKWFQVPTFRTPKMDIYEDNGNVVAEVELPGVDPKNIEVEVRDNILKIEAKTEEKKEKKGKGYYRKELSRGYYKRAVPLPVEVIEGKANAVYEDGILRVTVPKSKPERKKGKSVKIKVKKEKKTK